MTLAVTSILVVAATIGGASWPSTVHAETLKSAMAAAYKGNPTLDAERARLRATDEGVQEARAGWAPSIQADASVGITDTRTRGQPRDFERAKDVGISLTQPLFTGFRTYNAVNEAEANVRAGRAELRDVEAELLEDVAEAYLNVVRDRQLVAIGTKTTNIITRELALARTRLAVGEVTNTDVDQARSRRAEAQVSLEQFKGALRASEATYRRLVGHPARRTTVKGNRFGKIPARLSSAIAITRKENPLVERALYREQSSRFAVSRERSELMPRVDLEAGYTHAYSNNGSATRTDTTEVIGRLMVPLYQGGLQRSRIRQAKHIHVSRLQEIEEARRAATNNLRNAWAAYRAASAQIKSDIVRVRAVESALRGVRQEEKVGQRTVLDVLNAEEEVFEARSSLVGNQRNRDFSHYQILRAMGRLDARFLTLAKKQYDPQAHYFEARRKWVTTAITKQHRAKPSNAHTWGSSVTKASKLGGPRAKITTASTTQSQTTLAKPRSRLQVRRAMRKRGTRKRRDSGTAKRTASRRATNKQRRQRTAKNQTTPAPKRTVMTKDIAPLIMLRGGVQPASPTSTQIGLRR